jgi:hypothetical protein
MNLHSKKSILFNKIDIAIGKKMYGNTTGFLQNINDRKKVLTKVNESMKNTEPELYSLVKKGFTEFPFQYDKSLIKSLQQKFHNLIEDDTFSFAHSGYKDQDFGRIIQDPSKNFPEISKLITKDVFALVKKYYNNHFTISNIQCGRNYHVPLEIRKNFETFSNFWHNDKDPVSQFKYFVYLTDVTEKDGPFHVLTKDRSIELIKLGFGNRMDYKLSGNIIEDSKYLTKMTGHAGTSFFGSPPLCLHRAGDPEEDHFRDLVQFTFQASDKPMKENWINEVPGTPSNIIPRKYTP